MIWYTASVMAVIMTADKSDDEIVARWGAQRQVDRGWRARERVRPPPRLVLEDKPERPADVREF